MIFYRSIVNSKGGLISESFSLWLKSLKIQISKKTNVPNHSPEHCPPKEKMLRRVI